MKLECCARFRNAHVCGLQARGSAESSKAARTHAQNESESALSHSAAARALPAAVRTVHFLNEFIDDDEPLTAADGTQPWALDAPVPTHAPGLSWFDFLLEKLKHPSAAEVVTSLQRFVASFFDQDVALMMAEDPQKAPSMVHAFLHRTEGQMREHTLWKTETAAQWEDTREAIERFVFHKIYDHVFAVTAEDIEHDIALENRLASLSFITFEHLDVKSFSSGDESHPGWVQADEALQAMNSDRCPAGKLDCIVACSKIVTRMLTEARNDGTPPGADDFLPALILVLKRSRPEKLHSNMQFIQHYRHRSKLVSEAGYIFTNLLSASQFLESLDETALTIDPAEFHRGIAASRATMQAKLEEHSLREATVAVAEPPPADNVDEKTIHEIRALRLGSTLVCSLPQPPRSDIDKPSAIRSRYRFLDSTAEQLRVGDVRQLLADYRELCHTCEALLQANGGGK